MYRWASIARAQTADLVSHGFTVTAVGSRNRPNADTFASVVSLMARRASVVKNP